MNCSAATAERHELKLMSLHYDTLTALLKPEHASDFSFIKYVWLHQAALCYRVFELFIAGDLEDSLSRNPAMFTHILGNLDATFARWNIPEFFDATIRRVRPERGWGPAAGERRRAAGADASARAGALRRAGALHVREQPGGRRPCFTGGGVHSHVH
jgi:hypothetical protein